MCAYLGKINNERKIVLVTKSENKCNPPVRLILAAFQARNIITE